VKQRVCHSSVSIECMRWHLCLASSISSELTVAGVGSSLRANLFVIFVFHRSWWMFGNQEAKFLLYSFFCIHVRCVIFNSCNFFMYRLLVHNRSSILFLLLLLWLFSWRALMIGLVSSRLAQFPSVNAIFFLNSWLLFFSCWSCINFVLKN